eukprot:434030_1
MERIQARQTQSKMGWASVKAALSGDSLVLIGQTSRPGQVPPEKILVLSGISAPKFSRRPADSDENFAFAAREFLRERLIGQNVQFFIENADAEIGRSFGDVFFRDSSVREAVVAHGWAEVNQKAQKDLPDLVELNLKAANEKVGKYQEDVPDLQKCREIDWEIRADEFYQQHRGKTLPAIVDQVRDGSSVRCEILSGGPELNHSFINHKKRKEESNSDVEMPHEQAPPPFAVEAKRFTESRLLHRSVNIRIEGCDKSNNVYGTVIVPQGNIGELLLKSGLGFFVGWTAKNTLNLESMIAAEADAKRRVVRIWKDGISTSSGQSALSQGFITKVLDIKSGDSIVVEDPEDPNKEFRVSLSSIRTPRMANRFDKKVDDPFARDSRENLRKRVIGKRVKVFVEYSRAFTMLGASNAAPRQYGSVFSGTQNLAELQLKCGFASVVPHGVSDERSHFYDVLIDAENYAKDNKKGIFGPKQTSSPIVDLTERFSRKLETDPSEQLRKQYNERLAGKLFSSFQNKRMEAVVEYVFSGSRFKLFFPSENTVISFVLQGVRCERHVTEAGEPSADQSGVQALKLSRNLCHQRTVNVQINAFLDKTQGFLGTLWIDKDDMGVILLQEGFAKTMRNASSVLVNAEQLAKTMRKGVWESFVEKPVEVKAVEEDCTVYNKIDPVDVSVTEVVDAANFWIRYKSSEQDITKIQENIRQCNPSGPKGFKPHRGVLCLGKFHGDWYRCRVIAEDKETGQYSVLFIDYGNDDLVNSSCLSSMPDDLKNRPPLAVRCKLVGLRGPPHTGEFAHDAAHALYDFVSGKDLNMSVSYKESQMIHVLLGTEGSPIDSVNTNMCVSGFCRLDTNIPGHLRDSIAEIEEMVSVAKSHRIGMWRYGDCGSDDEI